MRVNDLQNIPNTPFIPVWPGFFLVLASGGGCGGRVSDRHVYATSLSAGSAGAVWRKMPNAAAVPRSMPDKGQIRQHLAKDGPADFELGVLGRAAAQFTAAEGLLKDRPGRAFEPCGGLPSQVHFHSHLSRRMPARDDSPSTGRRWCSWQWAFAYPHVTVLGMPSTVPDAELRALQTVHPKAPQTLPIPGGSPCS